MPNDHPQGTTILVLGILSLVVCAPLGIAAWIMGKKALEESKTRHYSNEGNIKAGYVCGIIGTVIMIIMILFFLLFFVGMGVFATSVESSFSTP